MTRMAEYIAEKLQGLADAYNAAVKQLITPVYNVVGYGAKGDGVTDDTSAYDDAYSACTTAGGGVIVFPYGTYLGSFKLAHDNIMLLGLNATLLGDGTNPVLNINPDSAISNVTVEGFIINGGASASAANNDGIKIKNLQHSNFNRLTIKNCGNTGINLYDNSFGNRFDSVLIRDCLYNYGLNIVKGTYRCNANFFNKLTILDCKGGIYQNDALSNIIDNYWIEDLDGAEMTDPAIKLVSCRAIMVENGYIECGGSTGYLVDISSDISSRLMNSIISTSSTSATGLITLGGRSSVIESIRTLLTGSATGIIGINIDGGSWHRVKNCDFFGTYSSKVTDTSSKSEVLLEGDKNIDYYSAANTTDKLIDVRTDADNYPRHDVLADGKHEWGGGSGAIDTNLYRSAANILKTDDKFVAAAGIGVGNSAAATTLGSVVKKIEVFDASGNSIGFVPVYATIT